VLHSGFARLPVAQIVSSASRALIIKYNATNRNHLFLFFSCFVALVFLIPTRVYGWGKDGHAAIVRLAFQLMPPAERERLYAREQELAATRAGAD
jgi:hypothetical protein